MKKSVYVGMLLTIAFAISSSVGTSIAQSDECESCPMTVSAEAKEHLKVTDGNGAIHYACCIGCALKTLKTYDTLAIETYCDWYGPDYPIIAEFSQHGNVSSVDPATALLLMGGGCTGNRVAYNQTAADALLANGFSEHTMMMMQQVLPANTNVTTIPKRAMTFAITTEDAAPQSSYLLPAVLAIAGIVVIAGAIIAYRKLKR